MIIHYHAMCGIIAGGVMSMISERIRRLREENGMSQAELARRLDVTRSSVNAWESGLSAPTIQYVVAMTRLFLTIFWERNRNIRCPCGATPRRRYAC
jgi:transcriptional regulator with XRE-family HTH domain